MKRINKTDYLHAISCAKYAKKCGYRNLEYNQGYKIYQWCKKYLDTQKLDFQILEFWVVKKDSQGYKRGQKIMSRKKMQRFVALGGKVRTIRCHKKETRKAMKELIEQLDITDKNQHGFTKGRDIFTAMEQASQFATRRNFKVSVASLDLSNAFEQITKNQIYAIFRIIFKLNKKHAEKLSEIMTINNKLFQGNVISPQLFNIWFLKVYSQLEKVVNRAGNFKLISYADDLTVITLYPSMSWKFLNFIKRIIKQAGFQINSRKTRIKNGKDMEICGLQWKTNANGEWKIYPRKTQKLKKLIRLWNFILAKNPLAQTPRLNKNGGQIFAYEMSKGLENWYKRTMNFQPI